MARPSHPPRLDYSNYNAVPNLGNNSVGIKTIFKDFPLSNLNAL
jgi:hypothetical protein